MTVPLAQGIARQVCFDGFLSYLADCGVVREPAVAIRAGLLAHLDLGLAVACQAHEEGGDR